MNLVETVNWILIARGAGIGQAKSVASTWGIRKAWQKPIISQPRLILIIHYACEPQFVEATRVSKLIPHTLGLVKMQTFQKSFPLIAEAFIIFAGHLTIYLRTKAARKTEAQTVIPGNLNY